VRKRLSLLATAAAFAGVIAMAPTASAEADPPGCPRGYFCAWSGPNQTGQLLVKTAGNWTGSEPIQSIFNNGYSYPGADHVDVTIEYGEYRDTFCVHHNPGPGQYKSNHAVWTWIVGVRWRGECP
jgi:hypothetical protein